MKKILLTISIVLMAGALIAVFSTPATAKVVGACGGCHTMHNSQHGADMALNGGPNNYLLMNSCVGCHTGDNVGGSTPYVMGINQPDYGTNTLAGGNFWWCENVSDTQGHNVFTANPDEVLIASGGAPGGEFNSCGQDSCHNNLHAPYAGTVDGRNGKYGCEGCHLKPRHHADDSASVVGESGGWYRFLSGHLSGGGQGVEGVEAPDWELNASSTSHNEYLGLDMSKTSGGHMSTSGANTTTAYCTGCHGHFHQQDTTSTGESPWLRHPSDAVLPPAGEYAGYDEYDPNAPVARPSLPVASPGTVTPGTDMVMCLSCHRPHGSPYDDLLRWNYQAMQAGTSGDINTGCFACHRDKDTGA